MTQNVFAIPEGWNIQSNAKPIPDFRFDYDFWHEDHDGENGLCGTGSSVQDCIDQINDIEVMA